MLIPDNDKYYAVPRRDDIAVGDKVNEKCDVIDHKYGPNDAMYVCKDEIFIYDFLLKKHAYDENKDKYRAELGDKYPQARMNYSTNICIAWYHDKLYCYAWTLDEPKLFMDVTSKCIIGTTESIIDNDLIFVIPIKERKSALNMLYDVISEYNVKIVPLPTKKSEIYEYFYQLYHGFWNIDRGGIMWGDSSYNVLESDSCYNLPLIENNKIKFGENKVKYYWIEYKKNQYVPRSYHEFDNVQKNTLKYRRAIMKNLIVKSNSDPAFIEWYQNDGMIVTTVDPVYTKYLELIDLMNKYQFDDCRKWSKCYGKDEDYTKKYDEIVKLYGSGMFNAVCPVLRFYANRYAKAVEDNKCHTVYTEKHDHYYYFDLLGDDMFEIAGKIPSTDELIEHYSMVCSSGYEDPIITVRDTKMIFKHTIKNFLNHISVYSEGYKHKAYKKLKYLEQFTAGFVSVDNMFPSDVLKKIKN
jgi:hypothetical protein